MTSSRKRQRLYLVLLFSVGLLALSGIASSFFVPIMDCRTCHQIGFAPWTGMRCPHCHGHGTRTVWEVLFPDKTWEEKAWKDLRPEKIPQVW